MPLVVAVWGLFLGLLPVKFLLQNSKVSKGLTRFTFKHAAEEQCEQISLDSVCKITL